MDVKTSVGLPIDVLNFVNLLNDNWGQYEFLDFQALNALAYRGVDAATGEAIYDIATLASATFRTFTIDNPRSRWQAQFDLRMRF